MEKSDRETVKNCANLLADMCMELGAESAETTVIRNNKVFNVQVVVEVDEINAQRMCND